MQSTLLTSFLKALKLKWWMADPSNLVLIQQIRSLYNKIYSPNSADGVSTVHEDKLEENNNNAWALLLGTKIPGNLRPLLSLAGAKIHLHARFKQGGIVHHSIFKHLDSLFSQD